MTPSSNSFASSATPRRPPKAKPAEVRAQLYVALDAGYIDDAQFEALRSRVDLCGRQLGGFISYLEKHKDRRRVKKSAVEYEIEEGLAG